eukprot:scaffold1483_cov374-Pavlova_lutheri.AAC.3
MASTTFATTPSAAAALDQFSRKLRRRYERNPFDPPAGSHVLSIHRTRDETQVVGMDETRRHGKVFGFCIARAHNVL